MAFVLLLTCHNWQVYMSNPFSTDYKSPLPASKYFKMQDEGSYLIRVLTPKTKVVSYFSEFVDSGDGIKKICIPDNGDGVIPAGNSENGFKLRWAVKILNKDTNEVQVWEISQATIREFLFAIAKGKIKSDWTQFDIQITKKGQKMETTYTLIADDTKPLTPEELAIANAVDVNLEALPEGEDPFAPKHVFEIRKDEPSVTPVLNDSDIEDITSNIQMPF